MYIKSIESIIFTVIQNDFATGRALEIQMNTDSRKILIRLLSVNAVMWLSITYEL